MGSTQDSCRKEVANRLFSGRELLLFGPFLQLFPFIRQLNRWTNGKILGVRFPSTVSNMNCTFMCKKKDIQHQ
jgi:hypothetical protein